MKLEKNSYGTVAEKQTWTGNYNKSNSQRKFTVS